MVRTEENHLFTRYGLHSHTETSDISVEVSRQVIVPATEMYNVCNQITVLYNGKRNLDGLKQNVDPRTLRFASEDN